MKKTLLIAVTVICLIALTANSVAAFDELSIVGTNTAPVIDCKLDDCYVKVHDFYSPNEAEWYDASDAAHESVGECWATWDADCLYLYFKAAENDYSPSNGPTVSSNGSCVYLALLATLPVDTLPENDMYICQLAINRDENDELQWKYTGSVVEEFRDNSVDQLIYDACPFTFDVSADGTYTTYEIALPWNQLDRTGEVKFTEGHKFFFNYIVCISNDGTQTIAQYGQGLMNDIYDTGGNATLVAAPVVEAAPEPEPEPEVIEAAPEAEAAPVTVTTPAAQTGDLVILAAVSACAALAAFIGKKKQK